MDAKIKRPKVAITGYKYRAMEGELCETEGCKRRGAHHGLYAKNTKKGLVWICFHCAKFVDKII